MHKVDLNLFPILLALYDELSVSRAARELSMSQPAVSMALRKMRGTFNDPLFVRAAKGMTPTPRAHALVAVARPLVTRVQEGVLAEVESPATRAAARRPPALKWPARGRRFPDRSGAARRTGRTCP